MADAVKPLNVSSEIQQGVPVWEAIVSIIFTAPIIFFTIAGNILVIIAIFTHKPLRNVQNFFIVSLAVTDLLVGLLMFPVGVLEALGIRWKLLGTNLCRGVITSVAVCCASSIFNLCAIALDRYWAVADPIAYAEKRTFKRVISIICFVWFLSFSVCLLPFLGWNDWAETGDESCRFSEVNSYVFCSSFFFFFIPFCILIFVYFRIYQIIKERLKARFQGNVIGMAQVPDSARFSVTEDCPENIAYIPSPERQTTDRQTKPKTPKQQTNGRQTEPKIPIKQDHSKAHSLQVPTISIAVNLTPDNSTQELSLDNDQLRKHDIFTVTVFAEKQRISLTKERRIIKTLAIIVGTFFVCMSPFFLWYNIIAFCPSCIRPHAKIVNFIWWIAFINSSLNPVIYTVFNKDFRDAFRKMLKC